MKRVVYIVVLAFMVLMPWRALAQEPVAMVPTVGREITFVCNTIDSADDNAVIEGYCYSAPYKLLAYRLLQQAVRLAPSIDMVATSVNEEGTLAVYDNSDRTYYASPEINPFFVYDEHDA